MNNAQRIDIEFIKRCDEFAKPYVEEILNTRNNRDRNWRKNNPEKFKAAQKICDVRRRMRKYMAKLILSPKERKEIKEFYINCPPGYEVDHIIPISKGGNHTIENLQYLTKKENREKNAKWIGIKNGECYDPNFLLKRLEDELKENEENLEICVLNIYTIEDQRRDNFLKEINERKLN